MTNISDSDITAWDTLILTLAKKRSSIVGVELDDLIQEGRTSVLLCLLGNVSPSELDIKNSMRRWVNACKKQSHVSYDVRSI